MTALQHQEPDRCPMRISFTLRDGLILGPTHNLQLDTPLENFWAMVDTIRQTAYSSL